MSKRKGTSSPRKESPAELVLTGEVTIGSLDELQKGFLAALEGQGQVHVETRELTYMDAAALQLLWALRRECEARGRPLYVEPPSDTVRKDAERLGMQGVFANAGKQQTAIGQNGTHG